MCVSNPVDKTTYDCRSVWLWVRWKLTKKNLKANLNKTKQTHTQSTKAIVGFYTIRNCQTYIQPNPCLK